MGRRLVETMQVQLVLEPNIDIVTDNMLAEWGDTPFAQLSLLLVHLRYLAFVHQTHHWTCKGDSFYGDHKLFEDLYSRTVEDIDELAEKAVGLGTVESVNLPLQMQQLAKLVSGYGTSMTLPTSSDLAQRSLVAEINFLKVAKNMACSLQEAGKMTRGLDNLLAGIEDRHEMNVFHLKQRCSR